MKHASLLFAVVAGCAGSPPMTSTPDMAPAPTALELGEITLVEGTDAMLKLHADGSSELGYHSGSATLTPGKPFSSDALPIVWKPGPHFATDGTISANGKPGVKLNADGTVTNLADHAVLPIVVTADRVTLTGHGAIVVGTDGVLIFDGPGAATAAKPTKIVGADTPGKRRAILTMVGIMLMPGDTVTTTTATSTAAAPAEPPAPQ